MAGDSVQALPMTDVFQTSFEAIGVINADGKISFVNDAWCQLLGYLPSELLNQKLISFIPDEHQFTVLEKLSQNVEVGSNRFETCLRKKSGELVWVMATPKAAEVSGTLICISDLSEIRRLREEAISVSLNLDKIVFDKTQALMLAHLEIEKEVQARRQVEERLERTQAEFKNFFESCPLYMGIVDLTEEGIRHVIDTPSVNRFFGLEDGGTAGMLATDLKVPPDNLNQWKIRCEQSRHENRPIHWEFSTTRGTGTLRIFSCYTSFIGINSDGTQRFSYTAEEITEKREMELKREQQSSHLSHHSKMSALGEMASGIAHEIYNPLAIIKGFADLLAKRNSQGQISRDELSSITSEILSTTRRMSEIIEGLRFFAREGSQDPFEFTSVENLVASTTKICAGRFKKYGVKLEIVHHDKDLAIACRDVQISQVLLNLLNNAFDAVRNEELKLIQIETQAHENFVLIRIQDSGAGVPESLKAKIFEPFFTTKPIGLGTGMGLSICKGIMESHFGSIHLIPSSQGACFQLRLPQDPSTAVKSERGH